jgi:hypothetical protein
MHKLIIPVLAILLVACASTNVNAPSATATACATQTSFSDPFSYCACTGNIDAPDARYTGAQMPEGLAKSLQRAMALPTTAPLQPLVDHSIWRCMDGKVYGCTFGANLPCQEKANEDRTPTQEMTDFCKANPASDFIPMAVTGRSTVYEWRCNSGAPEIVKQLTEPDARGFLSNVWYELEPATP